MRNFTICVSALVKRYPADDSEEVTWATHVKHMLYFNGFGKRHSFHEINYMYVHNV